MEQKETYNGFLVPPAATSQNAWCESRDCNIECASEPCLFDRDANGSIDAFAEWLKEEQCQVKE